ncbi:fumarylacetoacetate hydrolase family protein [Novosphingobium mathurense]|uniref:2-keto-4-pentenoate hydratase/2-oxohepta-3-ene-1,7-dioic acid hydratase (Catechol pathway) n=1 Tax=Novosphingobium mathurense TaxID=428990 RepID=A0A1U6IL70_9SPHN|nr:fumarylacetoacetate hydrolase family protein [Novosphingobium mathurense]SLK08779.1 2-keto-4-pentenoate hydratase/2-oxohepta-3-ene-1,7-dioic acid hydratase (catechol pathway) [Novosphingobium mathurense]
MKLFRFGGPGQEKPGALDKDGIRRDLSSVIDDIAGAALSREAIARLAALDLSGFPVVPDSERLGACVGAVGNFIGVGLNYADHAVEAGLPIPTEPILFNKAPSCIGGPNDDIILPRGSTKTDWEVELALVIGEPASYVEEADVPEIIAGYCICNDVSERAFQNERGGQWMKGKGCPTFGPLGPWLVTPDEIADVQNLGLWLSVNGQEMQNGTTGTMIFGVYQLVSHISQFMILEPGDVITTGTPPGVGFGMKPPLYLKAGDVIELGVGGLGTQHQRVVQPIDHADDGG